MTLNRRFSIVLMMALGLSATGYQVLAQKPAVGTRP